MNIGNLIATLGMDTTEFERKMIGASNRMASTGKQFQQVGKKMTMYLTLPLMGVGVGAFKMHKDFESSMSKIVGLVGIGKEVVEGWKSAVLDMAASVGISAGELAEALFFITSAGITGQEALNVLEIAAKAAASGLGETKAVADLLTSAILAYGSENLSAAQAADILTTAVREGKAEASEFAESLGKVLPLAVEMGVTFDQVGATIAAMTRTGTDANEASTALRGILSSMIKPSQQAEKALEGMGSSSAEFRKIIKEDGLIVALEKLRTLTGAYGEDMMAQVIPNIRALTGVLDLMGSNASDNIKIFDVLKNSTGALDHAFATASQTADFKYKQALTRSKTVMIQLGESVKSVFLPILEKLSGMLESLGNWFAGLSSTGKATVMTLVGLVAAIGPLAVGIGGLLRMTPLLTTGFLVLKGAVASFTKVMMANPILAITAGIVAAGVALYTYASRLTDAEKRQKQYKDAINETITPLVKEKMEINHLIGNIKRYKEGTDERARAIQRLNEKYPALLKNIDTESLTNAQLGGILNGVNEEYAKKIKLMALQTAQQEALNKASEAQMKLWQKQDELADMEAKGVQYTDTPGKVTKGVDNWLTRNLGLGETTGSADLDAYNRTKKEIEDLKKELITWETDLAAWSKKYDETMNDITKIKGGSWRELPDSPIDPNDTPLVDPDDITEAMTAYEALIAKIGELQAKIKDLRTIEEETGTPATGLSSLMDELTEAEAMKSRIEEIFTFKDLKENYKDLLQGMQQERETYGQTEIESLSIQENKLFTKLQEAKAKELALYRENAEKTMLVTAEYAEIELALMDEFSKKRAALRAAEAADKKKKLEEDITQIVEGLWTQDVQIRETYARYQKTVEDAVAANVISHTKGNELISQLNAAMEKELAGLTTTTESWSSVFENFAQQIIPDLIDSMGQMFTDVQKGFQSMVSAAIRAIKQLVMGLLAQAIAGMMAGEMHKGLLGLVTAGIGIAGIESMWSKHVDSNLQGLATGGIVTRAGQFLVGEQGPELVNLQAGAAVTPNHLLGTGNEDMYLHTRIAGKDLEVIMNRSKSQNKRR